MAPLIITLILFDTTDLGSHWYLLCSVSDDDEEEEEEVNPIYTDHEDEQPLDLK